MVLVAVILPVLIVIGSIVIDAGGWYQQGRHLQLQADAGALAGAEEFLPQGCQDAAIISRAKQYSGMAGGTSPIFNQIDGKSNSITERINSQSYAPQSHPPASDPTPLTGSPCSDGLLDIKMTEGGNGVGLPWYFQAARAVGINMGINAHARVSILQEAGGTGFEPLGLADPSPGAATAYFIDEDNPPPKGAPLATLPLQKSTNGQGQTVWSSNGNTVPVTINKPNVGVIIALSGSSQQTTCGQPGVNCFDLTPGPSLMHIQGYSLTGTGTVGAPLARRVTLVPSSGGCTDAYFAPNPGGSSCSFQVQADVDIGNVSTTPPPGVAVSAVVGGTSYPLTFSSVNPTTKVETWTGTASLASGTGSNQVDLQVTCDQAASNSLCPKKSTTKTISDVQRAYAQSSNTSGPIQSAYVVDPAGNPDQDSFEVCETGNNNCTHSLGVTITVAGGFSNTTTTNAPMYTLSYGNGTSASQTGAITCQPYSNGQFVQAVQNGCQGMYVCNGSVSAATNCVTDSGCANTNAMPGQTPSPPADCVNTNTGVSQGQIVQGFTARVTTPTNGSHYACPNNWPTSGPFVSPPSNDSRYITMFITPYGAFGGSGQGTYPIEGFAEFYVMGWSGDPCTSDPTVPGGGKDTGKVWGYFVQSITPATQAIGGSKCTPSTFGPCVAVLTQ
jgi:hypothetical protein